MAYLDALNYVLMVTVPVFILVFLGGVLKYLKHIDDSFIKTASSLVFNVCLPVLLFISILNNKVDLSVYGSLVVFCLVAAGLAFVVLWFASAYWVKAEDRGVVVQGAFRSNLGIIGLALCAKGFGAEGLAVGAVILAVVTPLYNVLSIYGLSHSLQGENNLSIGSVLSGIVKNPLIIAIVLGLLAGELSITLPVIVADAAQYIAAMTLPLALIAIGGSLSLKELKATSGISLQVVTIKLILIPLIVGFLAYRLGFTGVELGCILLMFASPTATASFIMVRAMGGNYPLASNIIVISTLLSAVSISLLLYVAKVLLWI